MSLVADAESGRLFGKPFAFVSYLANFANCPPGITYHRIGKMHTLGSLHKKWRRIEKGTGSRGHHAISLGFSRRCQPSRCKSALFFRR